MWSLLVLLVFSLTIHASTFVAEIRSIASPKSLRLRSEQELKSTSSQGTAFARPLCAKKASLPFGVEYSSAYEFYLVQASIGTPKQNFTLIVDTGSDPLWVCDAGSPPSGCARQPQPHVKRHFFSSNDSTTFSSVNTTFSFNYGSGSVDGNVGIDVFHFGPFVSRKQVFALATSVDATVNGFPFDGIFGHGWPWSRNPSFNVTGPLQNVLSQLDRKVFTVWYRQQTSVKAGENAGRITYGGVDDENCGPKWNYYHLINPIYEWTFSAKLGFTFGSFTYASPKDTILTDTGNPGISGPPKAIKVIVAAVGAEYDFKHDAYIAKCQQKNVPDLVFTFDTNQYTLPVSQLLVDVGRKDGKCVLTVSETAFPHFWVLGDAFVRGFCIAHDFGEKQIGFAVNRH
ncbi:CRE-ASP-1 protein [Aphelenchoides avenae]|nr:CRE-ASP-1 protein [Aphelenchus avenae]